MSRTQHGYARGDLVVVVDCADLVRAARFWAGALGYVSEGGADGASYATKSAECAIPGQYAPASHI
jgi:Glyoxalase-like domain